jgi:vitamin K-dependent gamma-carboxylase
VGKLRGAVDRSLASRLEDVLERATTPVDAASLAVFRALFGVVMFASTVRFVLKGWVGSQLVEPAFHFTYEGFGFVRPLPATAMLVLFGTLALAALSLAVDYRSRTSAGVFLVGFTYVELIDRATYLNHYYLVSLLAALLAILPSGNVLSLDARRGPPPSRRVPAWAVYALRLQFGVVYFYAGIAKLDADWLLAAQPLRIWLAARADLPIIGPFLAEPWVAYVAAAAGAIFDLGIVPMLSFKRTRSAAFVALVAFHALTGVLLPIGIFPFLMIAGATLFFPPDWPRRVLAATIPAVAGAEPPVDRWSVRALIVLVHCVVQAVLPLRGVFADGPSAWTMKGFNFSWRVMAAEKAGAVSFRVLDRATGATVRVEPGAYLTLPQERAMAQDPDMIRALALHVARDVARREHREVGVFADAFASLNGRPSIRFVDPSVDLTTSGGDFVLPLDDLR